MLIFGVAFSFLDLIFPKKCVWCGKFGAYICTSCFTKVEFLERPICPICQRQAVGGKTHPGCRKKYNLDGLVIACRYRGPIKAAIQKVKYKWVFDIEKVLVKLLSGQIWKFELPQDAILVPVPLHSARKRWRGFNQSEILAKTLAKEFGVLPKPLLVRTVNTKTQVGLSRQQRKKNIKGAFALLQAWNITITDVKDKDIILIDDVYTSGATMGEACKVLKKAGAKNVWGMAVALG